MATYPVFSVGEVLTADDMNAVGLWKITSATISALSTTGTNITSVFNNTLYANYRIVINVTAASTTNRLQFQLLSGTTAANTSYYAGGVGSDYASNTTTYFQRSNNDPQLYLGAATIENTRSLAFDVFAPHQARRTHFSGSYVDDGPVAQHWGGIHNVSTAYDGFKLFTNTGTLDLSYYVYGYKP